MWDIVSFGDVNTLNSVFNAIASIFNGNGFIAAASALALLVIVGSSLGSLASSQQELPFPKMMGAIIVFAMGFATFTNVSIENRYTGEVTQVDNIPVAIAVPASLISTIGLWLAETTETAFGSTGMNRITENGYLAPLKVFSKYREGTSLPCEVGSDIATVNGVNLCYTIPMYYSECTMVKAKKNNDYLSLKEGDALSEMNFNSRAFATNVMNASGQITTKSCADAYNDINNAMNSDGFSAIADAIGFPAGLRDGENGLIKTNDALEAIKADSGRSRAYMQATFARSLAEQGELAFYYRMGASDIAENIQSSIEQRNYQWALQGSLWVQIVDKFISLMECLIFALAPFIGLSVLMGSTGAKTVLLYLQMLAIIQIIPAMLVVAQSIVMKDMELTQSLLAMKYDVGSYAYNDAISEKAKELMGLGGMISSTIVPALAMALVTGSGMAVMGAFRQVGSAGKDSDATPDIAGQGGSTTKYDGLNSGKIDEHGNVMTDRAISNVGSIGQSIGFTNSVQSAQQEAQMASQQYSAQLSNTQSKIDSHNWTGQETRQIGENFTSSFNEGKQWQEQATQQLMNEKGLSHQQASNVVGTVGASAKLGLAMAGSGVDVNAAIQKMGSTLESKEEREAFSEMMSRTDSTSASALIGNAVESGYGRGETLSTGIQNIDNASLQLSKSASEMASKQDVYQKLSNTQESLELKNDDTRTQMYMLGSDQQVMDRVDSKIFDMNDNEKSFYLSKLDEYDGGVNANNMDDGTAKIMAFAATTNAFNKQDDLAEVITGGEYSNNINDSSLAPDSKVNGPDIDYGSLPRSELDMPTKENLEFQNRDIDRDKTLVAAHAVTSGYNLEISANNETETQGSLNNQEEKIDNTETGGYNAPAKDIFDKGTDGVKEVVKSMVSDDEQAPPQETKPEILEIPK